jgi:gamma-glutamylcyclotransferase (GGCT)/AIG2-like uncharacterized protein YtfP
MRIFVYGTLRQGGNNHQFLKKAYLIANHVALNGYIMYNYNESYPFAKPCNDLNRVIYGEIYEISPDTLSVLNRLEGTDEGLYMLMFEPRIEAWLYVIGPNAPKNLPEVASGDWLARS